MDTPGTQKTKRPPGRIVTFYSYKGGTGRSMALANVAWILASAGRRVLAIDWDFEAPGLHSYFHPFIEDKELTQTPGLIDFFVDFATVARCEAGSRTDDSNGPRWYEASTSLLGYAMPVKWPHENDGALDFVSAGRQDAGYATRVTGFDWRMFYEKLGGGLFLEALKKRLREDYDYILIDSRTGVSDISGICTVQLPDDLVVCFTFNSQSLLGASATADSAHRQRLKANGEPGLRIWPVAMRVELAEKDRLEAARDRARAAFQKFLGHMPRDERTSYWGSMEVLYQPYFAYEEVLAVFAERRQQTISIKMPLERLAAHVSRGDVVELGAMSESERQRGLAGYVQPKVVRAPPRLSTLHVFLSYSTDALSVAENIHEFLTRNGVNCWWDREIGIGDDWVRAQMIALRDATVVVAILGKTTSDWQLGALKDARARELPVIPVLLHDAALPVMLSMIQALRLHVDYPTAHELKALLTGIHRVARQSTVSDPVVLHPDDPQKGAWGGESLSNGRKLSASVYEVSRDWFAIELEVGTVTGEPLSGEVEFYLHPSFPESRLRVATSNGSARLVLHAWGAFTVGAVADGGTTKLELDLSEDPSFPEPFRLR